MKLQFLPCARTRIRRRQQAREVHRQEGNLKSHTAVVLKGAFDASFPDLKDVKKGEDRIPGRSLAELVAQGLRKHDLPADDPLNEEPFFVVHCRSGKIEYKILCYLLESQEVPAWVVECPRTMGLIAKWRGKSEEKELSAVVMAIHETLRNDSRVYEMRWFDELPAFPFEADRYETSPISAS